MRPIIDIDIMEAGQISIIIDIMEADYNPGCKIQLLES